MTAQPPSPHLTYRGRRGAPALNPDAIRGRLDMLILSVLDRHPTYGYALIEELRDRSHGMIDVPEGSVYPALHRLERGGRLTSTRRKANGKSRRYYTITPTGHTALSIERGNWEDLVAAVTAAISPPSPRAVDT